MTITWKNKKIKKNDIFKKYKEFENQKEKKMKKSSNQKKNSSKNQIIYYLFSRTKVFRIFFVKRRKINEQVHLTN